MPQHTQVQAPPQAEFLQGDIVRVFLPSTGAARLGDPEAAWSTAVCRVLSRLFSCKNPNPSRSPFCPTTV
jgi:hypothetical protein